MLSGLWSRVAGPFCPREQRWEQLVDDRKVDGPGGDEHKGLDGKDAAEYHALACEANEESGETCDRNAEG